MTAPWLDPGRFPRASRYHPSWAAAAVSGGANPLLLTEWLTQALPLRPGMRVLDLGSGRGASSVFLAREHDVEVWSVDLWFPADERQRRAEDAGVGRRVHALRADARVLPFAAEFFDAVVAIDCFGYVGTDDLYLPLLLRHLKPGGQLGIAGAGLTAELDDGVPAPLTRWWEPTLWSLHSADWWRRHWERSGLLKVTTADAMSDAWRSWLSWLELVAPENVVEREAVAADAGAVLTYTRVVAERTATPVEEPVATIEVDYTDVPVMVADLGAYRPGRLTP